MLTFVEVGLFVALLLEYSSLLNDSLEARDEMR